MQARKKRITILIVLLVTLIIAAGVCLVMVLDTTMDVIENPEKAFVKEEQPTPAPVIIVPTEQPEPTPTPIAYDVMYNDKMYVKNNDSVNIVLLGFDDMQDRKDDGGNTDAIMVCNIGFESNDMKIISVPRDTWTKVNEYDRDGNLEFTYNQKINAAFMAASNPKDRYPNSLSAIEYLFEVDSMFDVDMDYYCSIDIKDVPKLCEAVDGVPIVLDVSMDGIGSRGQTVVLDRLDAQYYLRDRSSGDGDLGRANRQRLFMIALAKKIQSMGGKNAALALYDDVLKYIDTNLAIEQIVALASLLNDINVDSIELCTIPGQTGGASYERPGSHYGDYRSVYLVEKQDMEKLIIDTYYKEVTQ